MSHCMRPESACQRWLILVRVTTSSLKRFGLTLRSSAWSHVTLADSRRAGAIHKAALGCQNWIFRAFTNPTWDVCQRRLLTEFEHLMQT